MATFCFATHFSQPILSRILWRYTFRNMEISEMDFDTNKYKVWKLPHPMLIHWVLNPGLAFNELILGQRVPKNNIDRQN